MKSSKILFCMLAVVLTILITGCSKAPTTESPENSALPSSGLTQSNEPSSSPSVASQEPLSPKTGSVQVGDITVTAEWIKLEEPILRSMSGGMAYTGDTLHFVSQKELIAAKITDGTAKFIKRTEITTSGSALSVDLNNLLYVNGEISEPDIMDAEHNKIGKGPVNGQYVMSEDWGISYWRDKDVNIINGTGTEAEAAPWVLSNLLDDAQRKGPFTMINTVNIMNDHILIGGEVAETKDSRLIVFDKSGKEIIRTTTEFKRDHPSFLAEGSNGYISGTTGTLEFWNKNGEPIEVSKTLIKDLFGVPTIWPTAAVREADGSILMLCTASPTPNQSELMIFRIKGF